VTGQWPEEAFERHLRDILAERYHHRHPFNERMHDGSLSKEQIRGWIANRVYYQEMIPIKDAYLLAKMPWEHRREWIQRIINHDGAKVGEGGIETWLALGEAAGLRRTEMLEHRLLVPGARFAVDAYVTFIRDHSWVEGVASSLTELAAPTLMTVRISAFEEYYPWVRREGLEYFQARVSQGATDASQALRIVQRYCRTREAQDAAVDALHFKCDMLNTFLDAVALGFPA
jgi:pyrroloquinoline-quinone synthase